MDVPAVKPVSSVTTSPGGKGPPVIPQVGTGKDLPPPPAAHLDPEVTQQLREKQAAVAQQMSAYLRSNSRDLEFQVDTQSGQAVITVLDAAGNVVRRIPGEEAMQMLRRVNVESGTFVDSMV